jgi:hypothetical protein
MASADPCRYCGGSHGWCDAELRARLVDAEGQRDHWRGLLRAAEAERDDARGQLAHALATGLDEAKRAREDIQTLLTSLGVLAFNSSRLHGERDAARAWARLWKRFARTSRRVDIAARDRARATLRAERDAFVERILGLRDALGRVAADNDCILDDPFACARRDCGPCSCCIAKAALAEDATSRDGGTNEAG